MKTQFIISFFTLSLSSMAIADTQIISSDRFGQTSTITSNGTMARIDNSADPGYVLIDLKKQQFRVVQPETREILDLGSQTVTPSDSTANKVNVKLSKLGKGPTIAGYSTQKYRLKANNNNCGTIIGSQKAMRQKGIDELFKAMSTMQQQSRNMMGGFSTMMDDCTRADLQSSDFYPTTGVPLKVIDQNGQVESEVKTINSRAKTAANFYQEPEGYQVVNIHEKMRQTQHKAEQQMQRSMPDMNRMMQQMQQDGSIPPEAMEQMKKMQEMFKQQFPQR